MIAVLCCVVRLQKGDNCLHYAIRAGGINTARYLLDSNAIASPKKCMNGKLAQVLAGWMVRNPYQFYCGPPKIPTSQQVDLVELLFEYELYTVITVCELYPV
jgi:ankyrin repeat protein